VSDRKLRKDRDAEKALRDLGYRRATAETRDQLETRHVIERTRQFLVEQGIDPDRALADARIAERRQHEAAKADAEHVRQLARALKKAKRAVFVAQTAWRLSRSGSDLWAVTSAEAQVQQLEAALRDACCNDAALIAEVKRQASR
jgi:hypothetical protein